MKSEGVAQATGSAVGLLDRLAVYCKLGLVYPPGNQRLARAEASLRGEIGVLAGPGGTIDFRFQGNQVVLEGRDPEPPGLSGLWLKERFDRSGLAGLELQEGLPSASLLAFALALGKTCIVKERGIPFERLWPDELPGIRLIQARFVFGEVSDNPDLRVKVAAEALAGNQSLRDRLDGLLALVGGGGAGEEGEILGSPFLEIAAILPEEALASPQAAVEAACRLLDEAAEVAAGGDLDRIARALGGGLFRLEQDKESLPSSGAGMRAAPESQVSGRIGPLLECHARLPELPPEWSLEASVLPPAEPLAVCLELASPSSKGAKPLPGLGVLLGQLLASPDSETVALVKRHLAPLQAQGREGSAHARSVFEHLEGAGHGRLLAEARLLHPAAAAATFPASFFYFFDSLDLGHSADRGRLQELWDLLDEQALESGGAAIVLGLQDPGRQARLLESPAPELLPLAGILFCRGEIKARGQAVRLLNRIELDPRASAALRLVGPPELLPPRYVWELARARPGSPALARARAMAGSILRSFLARSPEPSPARLQAISALADFPGEETRELLLALARRTGVLGFFGPPRQEREAARCALQRLERTARERKP